MNDVIQFLQTDTGSFLLALVVGSTFVCLLAQSMSQGDR